MRAGAAAGLVSLLALGNAVAIHAAPIDVLEACGQHVEPRLKGIESLNAQCPGLEEALSALGLPDKLPPTWRASLRVQALRDDARLTARYQSSPLSHAPDSASLHDVLSTLEHERAVKVSSWFDVLMAWLRSLCAKTDSRSLSWLQRLLDKIDAASGIIQIATYAVLALVLISALVFIVLELRSNGLFARRKRALATVTVPTLARPRGALDRGLDDAPLREKPLILLRVLVAALTSQGRLQANRHLTHRELVDQASLDNGNQRRQFRQLAGVAEEIIYASVEPSVEQIDAALREGQGLLHQVNLHVGASG